MMRVLVEGRDLFCCSLGCGVVRAVCINMGVGVASHGDMLRESWVVRGVKEELLLLFDQVSLAVCLRRWMRCVCEFLR